MKKIKAEMWVDFEYRDWVQIMKGQARHREYGRDELARYSEPVPLHFCGVTGSKDCTKRGSAGITPLITTTLAARLPYT